MTVMRSGQLTLDMTLAVLVHEAAGTDRTPAPSTGLVTSGRPMWSMTMGTSRRCEEVALFRAGRPVRSRARRASPRGRILSTIVAVVVVRFRVDQALDVVEADAAHTEFVHSGQFGLGDVGLDGDHAAGFVVGVFQNVQKCGIVRPVAGRLDDDILFEAEEVPQGEQLFPAGVAGSVFALRGEGEGVTRPEDVAVRIDRTGRDLEPWFARVRVPVEPCDVFDESVGAHTVTSF